MPSTTSNLLTCLTSKFSHISQLRNRFLRESKPSSADSLAITGSSAAFHHEQGRKLAQGETDVLYTQASWELKAAAAAAAPAPAPAPAPTPASTPAPARAADTITATNSSGDDVWSWRDSDDRDFSVAAVRRTPDTDLSAGSGEEDWRQEWEGISMQLKEGAKRRVVVKTIEEREKDQVHDFQFCEYNYLAALQAMEEPEPEYDEEGNTLSLDRLMEKFEEAKREMRIESSKTIFKRRVKQLREIALGDSDDEEEEVEAKVYSVDPGSMRTRDGELACGDWPGKAMMMAAGRHQYQK